MSSTSILLRRPLPPSAKREEKEENGNKEKNASQKTKSNTKHEKDDILGVSVSKRFDLIQRIRQRQQEILNLVKTRGPEPFPKREARKEPLTKLARYYGNDVFDKTPPEFVLEDFFVSNDQHSGAEEVLEKALVSSNAWDHIPQFVPFKNLSEVDQKVLHGVYIGETVPLPDIEPRKPWRQQLIEERATHLGFSSDYYQKQLVPYLPPEEDEVEFISKLLQALPDPHLHVSGSTFTGSPSPAQLIRDNAEFSLRDSKILLDMYTKFGADPADIDLLTQCPAGADAGVYKQRAENYMDDCNGELFIPVPVNCDGLFSEMGNTGDDLSPADLAIMNCLAHGGTKLDLKAHFLESLRHLAPSLVLTLTHVNLSFNEFLEIPNQLFGATELISLSMRSNPISFVPEDVSSWKKLRSLNLAFCYITQLPDSLFSLPSLEILDVSYNEIYVLPTSIGNLKQLKELYVDGNRLGAFPRSIVSLDLKILRCFNNFINKLFWRETAGPRVQSLKVCCVTTLSRGCATEDLVELLPESMRKTVMSAIVCDYCGSAAFDGGLPVVKPALELFGIKLLPILFHVCSQQCRKQLRKAEQLNNFD